MSPSASELYQLHRREFDIYENLLLKWNQKINLTAITKPEEIRVLHFEDSLSAVPLLISIVSEQSQNQAMPVLAGEANGPISGFIDEGFGEREGSLPASNVPRGTISLLDIGSGNGLPGLAIKIARPDFHVTLVDSVKKKCDFIKEVARKIDLKNVEVEHRHLDTKKATTTFDIVVSRAAFALKDFVHIASTRTKPGGLLIAWKARDSEDEIAEAESVCSSQGFSKFERMKYELHVAGKVWKREILCCKKLGHS